MSTDKMHATTCMQNTEEIIAKYAVDANLFRLGSTHRLKKVKIRLVGIIGKIGCLFCFGFCSGYCNCIKYFQKSSWPYYLE